MAKKKGMKLIANNKKAFHDYFIEDTYEAGIALAGTEVKSLRMGKCSIKESFIRVENGEVYIYGMHISPYEKGNIFNKDPLRIRKLLLHRYEINKIEAKLKEKGLTLVPLKVYFKDSLVKVEKHTLKLEIEKPQYITVNDVTYAQVDSWFGHCRRDLKLDIIYPEAQDGRTYPCILWICGGAWLMMDKSAHNLYLSRLASGGFVVASVEYRTSNQGPYPSE